MHNLLRRVENRAGRISALCNRLDLAAQGAPCHHNALVAADQVILGMKCDRPLADLCLVVAGQPLVLLGTQFGPALAGERGSEDRPIPFALMDFADVQDLVVRVVDWDRPADDVERSRLEPWLGHEAQRRKPGMRDAMKQLAVIEGTV